MRVTLNGIKRRGLDVWKGRAQWAHRRVLIWSDEHHAWWRPDYCGYTVHVAAAGIYSFADAWTATKHCGTEKRIAFQAVT